MTHPDIYDCPTCGCLLEVGHNDTWNAPTMVRCINKDCPEYHRVYLLEDQ